MKILVIGATGGSGRATCAALLDRGHHVTALARRASSLPLRAGLVTVDGDATDPGVVSTVMSGQDAVVVTLGIAEPTFRVRVLGARNTPNDIRSRGTRVIVDEAAKAGVRRLVVQSSYGVGESRAQLGRLDRLLLDLFIKPQLVDSTAQETLVRGSDLDWTIVQPVYLSDTELTDFHVSGDGTTRGRRVSRTAVGLLHAELVEQDTWVRRTVAVSG